MLRLKGQTRTRTHILSVLYHKRRITLKELSHEVNLAESTVRTYIKQLEDDGYIKRTVHNHGGKKSVGLEFNASAMYAYGVDVGSESVHIALTNMDLQIIDSRSFPLVARTEPDEIYRHISKIIVNMTRNNKLSKNMIAGIGVSLPGVVDTDTNTLGWAHALMKGNFDMTSFSRRVPLPLIFENDANAAAIAEVAHRANGKRHNLLYLSVTGGLGAGIVFDGKIHRGRNMRAGEVGHLRIRTEGRICPCGGRGCWERYASETALLEDYAMETKSDAKDLSHFFSNYRNNEAAAIRVWSRYLDYFADGLISLISLYDPDTIIIGGDFAAYGHLIIDGLKQRVLRRMAGIDNYDIEIQVSMLKNDAAVLGAAHLALQTLPFIA